MSTKEENISSAEVLARQSIEGEYAPEEPPPYNISLIWYFEDLYGWMAYFRTTLPDNKRYLIRYLIETNSMTVQIIVDAPMG